MNIGCKPCMDSERQKLLLEISKVDFALKELNLYLDTHPYDQQGMENFRQYNALKNKLVKDYTEKYGPLGLSIVDMDSRERKWATQDWPRGGRYN